jgi:hypothetical protein
MLGNPLENRNKYIKANNIFEGWMEFILTASCVLHQESGFTGLFSKMS